MEVLFSEWKAGFREGLSEICRLVKEAAEKLNVEIDTRQKETRDLRERQLQLEKDAILMSKDQKRYYSLIGVMIGIAVSVVAGLVVYLIQCYL